MSFVRPAGRKERGEGLAFQSLKALAAIARPTGRGAETPPAARGDTPPWGARCARVIDSDGKIPRAPAPATRRCGCVDRCIGTKRGGLWQRECSSARNCGALCRECGTFGREYRARKLGHSLLGRACVTEYRKQSHSCPRAAQWCVRAAGTRTAIARALAPRRRSLRSFRDWRVFQHDVPVETDHVRLRRLKLLVVGGPPACRQPQTNRTVSSEGFLRFASHARREFRGQRQKDEGT